MMTTSTDRLFRFGLCGILGLAVMIGSAGIGHAADDEDEPAIDTQIFRSILKGLGMRQNENSIDYRERSPLVLPQSRDLPKPDTASAADKTPQWPKDPDVQRAKKAKAERKYSNPNPEESGPIRPDQLDTGAPKRTVSDGRAPSIDGVGNPVAPSELQSKGLFSSGLFAKKEDYSTFSGEPSRAALTDPPPGYRTPSPTQPYGVGKEKWTEKSVPDRNVPVR
jgi:hypothetical protein